MYRTHLSQNKLRSALLTAVLASTLFAAAQPAAAPQDAAPSHVIAMINVQTTLDKAIDAKKAKAGDAVSVRVSAAATLSDGTAVTPGSILSGKIDSVSPSDKKSDSTVILTLDKLQIKGGKEIAVKAAVMQITSLVPDYGSDQGTPDPSNYRAGSQANSGQNNAAAPQGAHAIEGLTLAAPSHDAISASLTQAKKNMHIPSGALLQVSMAVIPPGVTLQ